MRFATPASPPVSIAGLAPARHGFRPIAARSRTGAADEERLLEDADAVRRPEQQERAPSEPGRVSLLGPGVECAARLREAPDVRILGVVTAVAHTEVAAGRNAVGCLPPRARRHVGLGRIERRSIDVDAV